MCIEYRVMFKWIRILRWRKLHVPQESGQRNRDHHETGLMIFMSGEHAGCAEAERRC